MNYKSIAWALLAAVAFASCKKTDEVKSQEPTSEKTVAPTEVIQPKVIDPNAKYGIMEFSNSEHDFGTINETDVVETVFKFKNTGEANLLISNAKGSCGCTVPEYPKEPIAPGASGEIKVSFSPKGKKGSQFKTVTLTTNSEKGTEILHIKANITQ